MDQNWEPDPGSGAVSFTPAEQRLTGVERVVAPVLEYLGEDAPLTREPARCLSSLVWKLKKRLGDLSFMLTKLPAADANRDTAVQRPRQGHAPSTVRTLIVHRRAVNRPLRRHRSSTFSSFGNHQRDV